MKTWMSYVTVKQGKIVVGDCSTTKTIPNVCIESKILLSLKWLLQTWGPDLQPISGQ